MSRTPLPYTSKILEIFRNPKNLGAMEDATVSAVAGSPACGDRISFYLKINEDEVIEKASFQSYGCAANIAASSITTELVKDKPLEEAWKVSWKQVLEELGGLPRVKSHCGILAVGALRRAIRKYFQMSEENPSWLDDQLTYEEKHALKEEELAKTLSKKQNKGREE